MKLSTTLVKIKGRHMPPENIVQGNDVRFPAGDTHDGWTREMRYTSLTRLESY